MRMTKKIVILLFYLIQLLPGNSAAYTEIEKRKILSVGPVCEIARNPRGGFTLGVNAGKGYTIRSYSILTNLSFVRNNENEMVNVISLQKTLLSKNKYDFGGLLEAGVISRTANLNDEITNNNSDRTKYIIRLGGGITYWPGSRFSIIQKAGLEYSAGRKMLPFVNMGVNLNFGSKR